MVDDPHNLARFLQAQDANQTYHHALAELRRGRKVSHWMWFVFPQIAGLGQSATARHYALASLQEAQAYLAHPVLGKRLLECSTITADHSERSAYDIFGDIDATKLRSSMTLFCRAQPHEAVFPHVLAVFFAAQPDAATDEILAQLALRHRSP